MGTEQRKAEVELAVFREFISKEGIGIDSASVRKHDGRSEPDISCTLSVGEQVAYELVEICSSDIAATFNKLRDGGAAGVAAGGNGDYAFAYLNLRMGRGRTEATQKLAGETLLAVAKTFFAPIMPIAIETNKYSATRASNIIVPISN